MRLFKLWFVLLALGVSPGQVHCQMALPAPSFGPQGTEGEPNRAQPWLIPSSAANTPAHALLFRPEGNGPFRLAVIAHASTQNELRRAQMPQPEYRALAGFLTSRGFAVLVPERLGHGVTGGSYLEDQGGCDEADYARAARATAAQIALAHEFMRASRLSVRTARSSSAIRPAAGARWRWRMRARTLSRPSSPLHPAAAAMPMMRRVRCARRRRCSPQPLCSASPRGFR
jgi:hypothetical protein